ncbi:pentatricopeptide repeat-containing protein At1g09900-like [Aristolochia californica]|uniref:pentatricopeptide repeat-containing protein At1g09900-like n=1 Tax=Aristolochia californica TaxID=171875 RepID=UPI0035D6417F
MSVSVSFGKCISARICRKEQFFCPILSFSALSTERIDDSEESFVFDGSRNSSQSDHLCNSTLLHDTRKVAASDFLRTAVSTLNLVGDIFGKPTIYDYNAILYNYLNSKDACAGEALKLFDDMKNFGICPNALTFNILLNGLLKLDKLEDTLFFAEAMCRSGFRPSFSSLMKLFKKSLGSSTLLHSFNVMEFMLRLDYVPTERSSNLLISDLCGVGKVSEAYFVFSILTDKGFFPTVYTYNPILLGLCKAGQSFVALAVLTSLKKKGFPLNVYSFTALVYGFSREGLYDEAYRILNQMQAEACKPNVVTFTTVIKFLCDDGKVEEALCVLDMMEGGECHADLITYNIVLHALFSECNILKACDIVGIMDKKGFSPDCFTFSAVVGGLLKSGYTGPANRFSLEYLAQGYGMDVVAWNVFIHALCRGIGSSNALCILKKLMKEGFVPTNVTYNTILNGFCKETIPG